MKLTPPVPLTPGQCDWLFNNRGYRCGAAATVGCPSLTPEGRFRWQRFCAIHKETMEALFVRLGEPFEAQEWEPITSAQP